MHAVVVDHGPRRQKQSLSFAEKSWTCYICRWICKTV